VGKGNGNSQGKHGRQQWKENALGWDLKKLTDNSTLLMLPVRKK